MKMIATIVLLLLLASGVALAQRYGGPGYYESRAATPGESHARGLSDVVRSQGAYNLATSEAAINMTQVSKQHMENREQWTNTYFEMRQANRAYRAAERGPRPTMEDLVRYAQAGKPKPLSPAELDSVAGNISWPMLFEAEKYEKYRSKLGGLFAKRANKGVVGRDDFFEINKTTKAMLAELKKEVREVPPMDYVDAKRFLQSLGYEARRPAS